MRRKILIAVLAAIALGGVVAAPVQASTLLTYSVNGTFSDGGSDESSTATLLYIYGAFDGGAELG
jgi:hypothetical protein